VPPTTLPSPRRSGTPDRNGSTAPPIYDLSYRDEVWRSRAYEDLCDRLALRAFLGDASGDLVDLGAGFGRLADEYDAFDTVTLVDASPTMIAAARQRVGADPRFSIVAADAARLPIPSQSVDVVVAVRLLVHLADPTEVFQEIARILRPGGILVVEFPNRRHLLASVRYLIGRQRWSPNGRRTHEYLPGHYSHQPRTIEAQLRYSGLEPGARRTVSLFRSERLKRLVSPRLLARIEAPLQAPLGGIAPGPSIYLRAIRSDLP
jgi:ubiquinone/menaquinone biosynthesis C-methylase UbiE